MLEARVVQKKRRPSTASRFCISYRVVAAQDGVQWMVEQMDACATEHMRSLARYASLARFIFRFMFYADTLAKEHLTSKVGIEFEPGPFYLL